MSNVQISPGRLRGLSFGIAELTLVEAWAEAQGLQMKVRLDHGSDTEEFEEVLAFTTTWGRPRRIIMWRDQDAVYIQPLIGRVRQYPTVAEAIATLTPQDRVAVTDVMASRWPA